jgi:hypothetical protein
VKAAGGGSTAVTETFTINITNGNLSVVFTNIANKDNAIVSGIELIPQTPAAPLALIAGPAAMIAAPASPTNLMAATISVSQINLAWSPVTGATGYTVQRSLNGQTGWTQIATTNIASWSDTALTAGTTYFYRIIASNGVDSVPSAVVSAVTQSFAFSSTLISQN